MADPKSGKKSIFDKAVDAVSNRDEKAAAEQAAKELASLKASLSQEQALRRQWEQKANAAQKEAETAKQALAAAQQTATSSKTATTTAEARITAAETRANAAEAKARQLEEQVRKYQAMEQQRIQEAQRQEVAQQAARVARKHKVVSGDTLSGLALKYYGSAAREKWMAIYEANKATIGDNPNVIRAGTELIIPDL
jgi:nucleoid-associated protein YgaU